MSITETVLALWIMVVAAGLSEGKEWHGIVPLHSTRADVERILGRAKSPVKSYASIYDTKGEVVSVDYSTGDACSGGVNQWQVPQDTVLDIHVAPRTDVRFTDLRLDLSKYQVTDGGHVPNYTYYTNDQEGVQIEVTQGLVMSISYFPAAKDGDLRCPGTRK